MNSPGYGFVPSREKVVEKPTLPRGRFTAPRENDAGRSKERFSRNRVFSTRGEFAPPNDKVMGKVTVQRNKANKPVFPKKRAEGIFPRCGSKDRVIPLSKRRFFP